MSSLLTLDDYERAAESKFDPAAWAYVAGGGADEITLRRNREVFGRVLLAPRVLRDVSTVDTRVTLLGHALTHPILLAPVAAHVLAHQDAEVGSARGAVASLAAGQYAQGMLWATQLAAPILLGADPAKLAPIRPRLFDLQVNVASAAAAGLTIPTDILDKASRVHGR